MANTFTQIHLHMIIAVQNRQSLIRDHWKQELYKYITTIIQNEDHKMLQINGMPDHMHILIGLRPKQSIAELMKQVKQRSSVWINENKMKFNKFTWQEGYACFSNSKSQLNKVINYIQNQENHHKKKTFKEEYVDFLEAYGINYDEKYIFKEVY